MDAPLDSGGSGRLLSWFSLAALAPVLGLVWLGWWALGQDRTLDGEQARQRREQAVELVAAALQRRLAEAEEQLTTAAAGKPGSVPAGSALVMFHPHGVVGRAGAALPFYPPAHVVEPRASTFRQADQLEFGEHALDDAITAVRALSASPVAVVRAESLLRLARLLKKTNDFAGATSALAALGELDSTPVGGLPADLVARQARALLLAHEGRQDQLGAEARRIAADLDAGRWILTRPQHEFAREQAATWIGSAAPPMPSETLALAEAAELVWTRWRSNLDFVSARGRRSLETPSGRVLVLWRTTSERCVVLMVGSAALEALWKADVRAIETSHQVAVGLSDVDGRELFGRASGSPASQAQRTIASTTLPWTLHVTDARPMPSGLSSRAWVIAGAIALTTLVTLVGLYTTRRALTRELAATRLQSDFVAAVSHEFRTPLTTLRQLSEMLATGRVSSDGRRQQFYESLFAETQRLQRLVESLLDFGRMDAGAMPYRFQSVDVAVLVREVVHDFRRKVDDLGHRVELTVTGDDAVVPADRDALERVIWNLLDNAVKYSPQCEAVWVDFAVSHDALELQVRDRGIGIPREEQAVIFGKFVRGAASRAGGVRGTGIGLAMAKSIVDAHRGAIRVVSAPGAGSTFIVSLPKVRS